MQMLPDDQEVQAANRDICLEPDPLLLCPRGFFLEAIRTSDVATGQGFQVGAWMIYLALCLEAHALIAEPEPLLEQKVPV